MNKIIGKILACVYCAVIVAATVYFTIRDANRNIIKDVTIEAGSQIKIEDFFKDCPDDARFVTDISGIDTSVPSIYMLKVFYDEAFEKDVTLRIEDHTAPKGIALPHNQYASLAWPEASECVGYLYDLSGIASIEYKNGVPDYQLTGDYLVPVVVTDWYNNSTVIEVPFHVTDDHNAPLFYGIHDITVGDAEDTVINYLDGITVTDDYDEDPFVMVDSSRVQIGEPGIYTVSYIAKDVAGNIRRQDAHVTIKSTDTDESVSGAGSMWDSPYHNELYRLAYDLLDELRGDDDRETALNIFTWVHSYVSYETVMGTVTFEEAAYNALTKHSGDCYGFYACCKVLLDCAGIPNMTVLRDPITYNGHYWNLVKIDGEWYHCDSTKFMNHQSLYFGLTDDEIMDSRHQFNGSMLPVRADGTPEYA